MKQLFTILLVASSAIAMEIEVRTFEEQPAAPLPLAENEQAQQSRFIVKYAGEHPILIKYTKNGAKLKRVVRSNIPQYICSPVLLSSVKVFMYGKYKGKSNIETVSGGLVKQADHAGKILSHIIKENPVDIYLEVSLPEGLKGAFSSFNCKVEVQKKVERLPLGKSLAQVFPHVSNLINSKSILSSITGDDAIALRHFLDVPNGANRESIEEAYRAMKYLWEKEDTELGRLVNHFLATSYTILIQHIELKEQEDKLLHQAELLLISNSSQKNINQSFSIDEDEEN